MTVSLHGKDYDDLVTPTRHRTRALSGVSLAEPLFRLAASSPRTVSPVIRYLTPTSTSNSTFLCRWLPGSAGAPRRTEVTGFGQARGVPDEQRDVEVARQGLDQMGVPEPEGPIRRYLAIWPGMTDSGTRTRKAA